MEARRGREAWARDGSGAPDARRRPGSLAGAGPGLLGCLAALLLAGCGWPATAVPAAPPAAMPPVGTTTGNPAPTGGSARPTDTASATAAGTMAGTVAPGYLEGRATIGPLQPVEIAGRPTPTPSPEVCTARGVIVSAVGSGAQVADITLQPDCAYRVSLPPGTYVVSLRRTGIDVSKQLPATVEIRSGQSARLDFDVDTGIR